jgi:GTP cyclohydrolase I
MKSVPPQWHKVAACLQAQLQPKGVGVVLEAEHLCMSLRGVQTPGAVTITSALHGLIRDDPRTREEFLSLTKDRGR